MYYSPLRYPGGKGKLAPFMELMIEKLNLKNGTYVEPFAGGAGVALDLLLNDFVAQIVINDFDKAISSFWKAVVNENERFIEMVNTIPVTIAEWYRQKEIIKCKQKYSFELGFATFYLNRTNRSGIISGGPIGGYAQDGEWKLNARFNKENLTRLIKKIGERKSDIYIYNKDVRSLITNYLPKYGRKTLIYFDPPYYDKGKKLYMNYLKKEDHIKIAQAIQGLIDCNWIITYDDVTEILEIYNQYEIKRFDLNYSVANKKIASELMIFPKGTLFPTEEELNQHGVKINFR